MSVVDLADVTWLDVRHGASVAPSGETLSSDEHARARRYLHARDRDRFIVRRGELRRLLAKRLGCAPARVPLARTTWGKPFVPGSSVRFSVSHSHDLAMFAIAEGIEIGCDIERADPALATQAVAERVFTEACLQVLASTPTELWIERFYEYWTLLEAELKAAGSGFVGPTVQAGGTSGSITKFFRPASGYFASVVVVGSSNH
jgi:4'-phosphopantetheinyl transferase